MLEKEEAIEEGRVKKNLKKKKGVQFGAPPGPRGLTGAHEQWRATPGRPWAPPGPILQQKFRLTNLGFLHPI